MKDLFSLHPIVHGLSMFYPLSIATESIIFAFELFLLIQLYISFHSCAYRINHKPAVLKFFAFCFPFSVPHEMFFLIPSSLTTVASSSTVIANPSLYKIQCKSFCIQNNNYYTLVDPIDLSHNITSGLSYCNQTFQMVIRVYKTGVFLFERDAGTHMQLTGQNNGNYPKKPIYWQ